MKLQPFYISCIDKTNHYILFAPLLILYTAYIIIAAPSHNNLSLYSDEFRYARYSQNMLHGFYTDNESQYLWNGPGYPILLMPFEALNLPYIFPRLLNGVLHFFSIIFFYKTLLFFLSKKKAVIAAYILGLYYPATIKLLPLLFTEPLVFFLVCAYAYNTFRLFKNSSYNFKIILLTAFLLASIAFTKIIFGYVILFGLLLFSLCAVIKKSSELKKTVLVYVFALFFCSPYLLYTYTLTNQLFYWGNAGGMQLYWMSSPYPEDLGDWYPFSEKIPNYSRNHKEFIDSLTGLNHVEQDKALKKKAIDNICHHPKKYVYNWTANIGRLLFGHPVSYFKKPSIYIYYYWPNAFIVFFSGLFIFPTLRCTKKIPFPLRSLLLFAFLYLGGSSLVSAYPRFFFVIVPILALWILYMLNRFVKLSFDS